VRFLCEACGELAELSRFRVEGAALVVQCARCRAELRAVVPAPQGGASEANVGALRAVEPSASGAVSAAESRGEAPADRCPKCVAPRREDATTCGQCGLVFVNATPSTYVPNASLLQAWQRVLSAWSEPRAHEAFVQEGLARGELAAVGRLYRIRLASRADDPEARKGLDEVVRLASVTSVALTPRGEKAARRPLWLAIALFVPALLFGYLAFSLWRGRG
jgi:hypothetical protein